MSKLRKGHGGGRTVSKTPVKETYLAVNHSKYDSKSEASDTQYMMMKMENTFKLKPDEDKRFRWKKVENAMNEVLKKNLEKVEYEKENCAKLSLTLSEAIKSKVREFRWTRYKFVVQVMIGENNQQDVRVGSRFLWNHETDTFATTTFENKTLFAIAVCWAVYYD